MGGVAVLEKEETGVKTTNEKTSTPKIQTSPIGRAVGDTQKRRGFYVLAVEPILSNANNVINELKRIEGKRSITFFGLTEESLWAPENSFRENIAEFYRKVLQYCCNKTNTVPVCYPPSSVRFSQLPQLPINFNYSSMETNINAIANIFSYQIAEEEAMARKIKRMFDEDFELGFLVMTGLRAERMNSLLESLNPVYLKQASDHPVLVYFKAIRSILLGGGTVVNHPSINFLDHAKKKLAERVEVKEWEYKSFEQQCEIDEKKYQIFCEVCRDLNDREVFQRLLVEYSAPLPKEFLFEWQNYVRLARESLKD